MNKSIIFIGILFLLSSCSEDASPLTNNEDSSQNSDYIIEGCEKTYSEIGVYNEGDFFIDSDANGVWDAAEAFTDTGNGVYDQGEVYTDSGNDLYDEGEAFTDCNDDLSLCDGDEGWSDDLGNGIWDAAEDFTDENANGVWDDAEDFTDKNANGVWDDAEDFTDLICDENCQITDYSNDAEDALYDCYNSNDLAVLSDFKESNSSLNAEENILDIGYQSWVEGRLVYLSFDENIDENDSGWPVIEVIPESIGDLSELITLFLGSNEIVLIPESIGQLVRLNNLGLQNNLIEFIPESIGELAELDFLYLYNNNISLLPQSISNLSNLITSAFSENNLCEEYHYDWITEFYPQDQTNCP